MKAFQKLALTSAIGVSLAAASLPSYAIVEAIAEAQLIPLVVYAHGEEEGQAAGDVNTVINVTVPNVIGWEDVANTFLAPNTSPTNPTVGPGALLFPDNQALLEPISSYIHWYWFDYRSIHRINRRVPVTPDDMVQINWSDQTGGTFLNGVPGYMVISTETGSTGAAADFAFFADAHLLWANGPDNSAYSSDIWTIKIPVLGLVDGADGAFNAPVTNADNVKYNGARIPRAVSPLISGIRSNLNDGAIDDVVVFDVTLSNRRYDTLAVVWVDTNLDDVEGYNTFIPVDVFDTYENSCSATIEIPYELNLIWIPGTSGTESPFTTGAAADITDPDNGWASQAELCIPFDEDGDQTTNDAGFVRAQMPEYIDETTLGITGPESSIYAFSITFDRVGTDLPNWLNGAVALGHDRGMFDN